MDGLKGARQARTASTAACLEWLKDSLYPNGITCQVCQRVTKHHRVRRRRSYSCDVCGHHVHPTAHTLYHKSRTPLRLWFTAISRMAATRGRISAKQLQRELGVTYKTAWRMSTRIRSRLAEPVAKKKVEATAGGGMVTVEANGKQELLSIKIDPEVINKDNAQMLEDLVLAACNEALRKSRELRSSHTTPTRLSVGTISRRN